jgi:hypothetical protein
MPTDLPRAAAFVFGLWLALETFGGLADAVANSTGKPTASRDVSTPAASH